MEWQFVVAMAVAVPIILFPVVFAWYLTLGAAGAAFKKFARKAGRREMVARTATR